ncbi:TetR/AcrR family transcriptional regulator [Nguyenibacter vanlangensis]|uniref:TetR/AcrR family transcriptional regulator n=1 Tax=Nguyenibacter vanlangensis TaxID=1216886 RepID=A0A7Y7IV08_9PROT|nr:TetR/AcrR family transcriptional regulator [Nguyenibacter vanlangensis]
MLQSQVEIRRRRPDNHALLLDTADTLFARSGFHDVSVEDIAREAKVTKSTLYRHFGGKENLVTEVLENRIVQIEASLAAAVNARQDPRDRLKAVFDWHTAWFAQPDFAGCMFPLAAREYKGEHPEIIRLSEVQKLSLRNAVRALVEAIGVPESRSEHLARQIICLLDGAVVSAQLLGEKDAADIAWNMAETALSAELVPSRSTTGW